MTSVDTTGLPIGKGLKVERVVAGIDARRVAHAVGISPSHLSRIESGERVASLELVERIRIAIRAAAGAAR